MKKNKKNEVPSMNYLDLIPQKAQGMGWHKDFRNRVILEIENTGMFNRIAQKIFGKPKYSKIHLDEFGSFIWPLIDGQKTVEELAQLVKAEYGEKAEPLYPRIIKYFQIVEGYHFIRFINRD